MELSMQSTDLFDFCYSSLKSKRPKGKSDAVVAEAIADADLMMQAADLASQIMSQQWRREFRLAQAAPTEADRQSALVELISLLEKLIARSANGELPSLEEMQAALLVIVKAKWAASLPVEESTV
jgi:hypothetical protein